MKKDRHFQGNKCVLFLLVILFTQSSYAQLGPAEIGLTIAPSNFLGDLGGTHGKGRGFIKDNNLSMTKLMVGAHLSVNPTDWLSFRLAINKGTIAGDDAIIEPKGGAEEDRIARNQNFKSKIVEGFLAAEIYPTALFEEDPADVYHKMRPYGIIGGGFFHFNPEGQDPLTGNWIFLKPLHTEGQGFAEHPDRKEYKLTQKMITTGVGIKYFIDNNVNISFEIIHRKTFSDYLDDVSTKYIDPNLFYQYLPNDQAIIAERMYDKSLGTLNRNAGDKRGTSTNMDGYYSMGIKLSFRLSNRSDEGYRNSTGCPVIRL